MQSPCEKICVIDPVTRTCSGCGRTLEEIANWTRYSDAERARIMARLVREKDKVTEKGRR